MSDRDPLSERQRTPPERCRAGVIHLLDKELARCRVERQTDRAACLQGNVPGREISTGDLIRSGIDWIWLYRSNSRSYARSNDAEDDEHHYQLGQSVSGARAHRKEPTLML
jgi:hypothetical protein